MSTLSRREIIKGAALVTGGAMLGAPATAAAGDPKDGATLNRLTATLADFIRHKFASHDLAGEMKAIEEDVRWNLQTGEQMNRIPLQNGDEPDFIFVAE